MATEKRDKNIGYLLLAVGIVLIIIPVILALSLLLGAMSVPQLVKAPSSVTDDLAIASVAFSNACLIFFVLLVMMWGGSIVSSRGISLIRHVTFKVTREGTDTSEAIEEKPQKP